MTIEKRQRRDFTDDFKQDAVALVIEQGYSIAAAARSLDITAGLLGRWKRRIDTVFDVKQNCDGFFQYGSFCGARQHPQM